MTVPTPSFDTPALGPQLATMSDVELDAVDFGVIAFDMDTMVCRYNKVESNAAGLSPQRVLQQPFFTNVAPCMNNFMVAQRFDDAFEDGSALDVTIDYVLTLRMRPVKVALRLIADPGATVRYVLVRRQ